MKTYLECIPCFLNQALKAMSLCNENDKVKEKVLKEIIRKLADIDLNKKPTEFGKIAYDTILEITGNDDPYKEIKKRDNDHAISLLPTIKETIEKSEDRLFTAIKVAIAGNIMDFAVNSDYNLKNTMENVLKADFAINDYRKFREDIKKAKSVAYFVDNAGEIVFDKLLIEEIKNVTNCKIYFFVRGKPIVNDATKIDAELVEIDKLEDIEIRETYDRFPDINEKDFSDFLKEMDVVISKGQANYESLSEADANTYFLLIAKCPLIARDLGVKKGDIIFKFNKQKI